jgi:cadmium resistance protein CadD (predicted permease)
MDALQKAAQENDLSTIITTGAVYGIFLVFGEAWSEFLKIAIISMAPTHDDQVFASFIHAISASGLCILVLVFIVKIHSCMKNSRPLSQIKHTVIKRRSLSLKSRNDMKK